MTNGPSIDGPQSVRRHPCERENPLWRTLQRSHALDAIHRLWAGRLTVLAYHRICPVTPDFPTLETNVSADPESFGEHLDIVAKRFDVIALDDLVGWLQGGSSLPKYPALITFDDGYRDTLEIAWPMLRRRRLPAALFVATACVGSSTPFYWDAAAHCFQKTCVDKATLPLLGERRWVDAAGRAAVRDDWLTAVKPLSPVSRRQAVADLANVLGLPPTSSAESAGLHADWAGLRAAQDEGLAIGAHTVTHPKLSALDPDAAHEEIAAGKRELEQQLGRSLTAFAYPYGAVADFSVEHERMVAALGFAAAFSLEPGPATLRAVRRRPLAIRRVCVTRADRPARFLAKLVGAVRAAAPLHEM
jgi:peptidoglycan/xylan/chitin deacetylase (PgdA/CDA1 family)